MICKKDGCMADCRIKDSGKEVVDFANEKNVEFTKQTYYCTLHGDRYSILRKEGYEDIIKNIN